MYQGEASAEFDPPSHHEEGPEDHEDCDPFTIFHLIHPLGRGSYGSVYKARVYETGEIVAVKIIPLTEQDEIGSIQKEVAVLRECNHPNVVKYYGSWRTPDSLWICMEYCAGGSVSDIMAACDCALEEDTIAYICSATLAGLAYLHSVGKVHRDIKCGNILLSEGGEVKLADFGVAAQLTNTMSKRNTFIGTPHWMAPEVIQTSHYDGKVDVWALGVCAIEMAERFPPRWKVNPNRVIFMIVRDPPPRLGDKERWSLAFQDFVAQCLNKDSRMRPTAKYLQQHKFVARDKAAAVRAILPLVNRARAFTAEMAAAAARAQTPSNNNNNEDGVFSWRDGAGIGATRLARSPLHAQHAQHAAAAAAGGPSGGAYGDTLPASSPHFLKAPMMSPGDMPLRSPPRHLSTLGTGTDASGTVLVRGGAAGGGPGAGAGAAGGEEFDYEGTVRMVAGARTPAEGPNRPLSDGFPEGFPSGTVVYHESPSRPTTAASPAGGADYLAAVKAVSEGHHSEMELAPYLQQPTPGRPVPARGQQKGPKSEAQRMIEKLHNLYSSGAVVPLPFLRATDAAPLSLLGLERGPPHMPGAEHTQQLQGADWEAALAGVLEEASGGGNEGWGGMDLPPMVQQQVQSSPVLLNLATTLAHHKRLLEQVVASQERAGWVGGGEGSGRLRAQLATKADDLADTLRTILCL